MRYEEAGKYKRNRRMVQRSSA